MLKPKSFPDGICWCQPKKLFPFKINIPSRYVGVRVMEMYMSFTPHIAIATHQVEHASGNFVRFLIFEQAFVDGIVHNIQNDHGQHQAHHGVEKIKA